MATTSLPTSINSSLQVYSPTPKGIGPILKHSNKLSIMNNEIISKIQAYVKARELHANASRLSNELSKFIDPNFNSLPWEEVKVIVAARDLLGKYVWGREQYDLWDEVEKAVNNNTTNP